MSKVKEKDNVRDWADKSINIAKGCSNNCRYCYAREMSVRWNGNKYENWTNEQLNEKVINKGWRKSTKKMMFPTTHVSADSQVDGLMVNKDEGCAALIGRIF
jgi:DNA repair photolyase